MPSFQSNDQDSALPAENLTGVANRLPTNKWSIKEVRQILKGGVERFDDPFEPMIPVDDWNCLNEAKNLNRGDAETQRGHQP